MGFRYLGNKTRLVHWVVEKIAATVPSGCRVADPMCGTAAVSFALANAGFKVTAADALRFPTVHAKARLLPQSGLDFSVAGGSLEGALDVLNGLEPRKALFWTEYSAEGRPSNGARPRKYLTGANAARIDAMRSQIRCWQQAGLEVDAVDLLLHQLILAVNKVASIAGTYGFYRAEFSSASLAPIAVEYPEPPAAGAIHHRVLQQNVEELAPSLQAELCYLDPPYTKRQYAGNYHLLETIALQDEPEPVGEGGLRDWYPQSSDFCSKRRVREALIGTLRQLCVPYVAMSYSEDGLIPPDELIELLACFGKTTRWELPMKRFRSNSGESNKAGAVHEHLYIVERT